MYYIKSKRKQNNFSQNELNALKCFSSVEEVLNFADKVSPKTLSADEEKLVEYLSNLKEMADKEKTVHPIVSKQIDDDIYLLKNWDWDKSNYKFYPSHIKYLPIDEDGKFEYKMANLGEEIRKLNISAGVKKPSVKINDSAAKILKSKGNIDKEVFDKYFSLPPEIRQLITKKEEANPEKKGIA